MYWSYQTKVKVGKIFFGGKAPATPAAQLHNRLRDAGPALHTLAPLRLQPALAPQLAAALTIERATRDRLVIFDPSSASLFRPLVGADELRSWHVASTGRWLIAVSEGDAPTTLAARHPALARYLDALAAPEVPTAKLPWWVLRPDDATPTPAPRIVVGGRPPLVAWHEAAALVGGPASIIHSAEPLWLALLGSRLGRWWLKFAASLDASEGNAALVQLVAQFPLPELPGPTQGTLEGLALSAATLAAQISELERAVLRRLLADFGPPGAQASSVLERWWQLEFVELRQELRTTLRNDIPARFQPTWAELHAEQRDTRARALLRLNEIEQAIDAQVVALYKLTPAEVALLDQA